MVDTDLLFSQHGIGDVLENQLIEMRKAVSRFDPDKMLNTSEEDLVVFFTQGYEIDPIRILEEKITVDQKEAEVAVGGDYGGRASLVTGTQVTLYVPFEGERGLLRIRPSTGTLNPPRGIVEESVLLLRWAGREPDEDQCKKDLDSQLSRVKQWTEWQLRDVERFNEDLGEKVRAEVTNRREKLLADRGLVTSLGFPLRKREGQQDTFSAPEVRRKVRRVTPPGGKGPYKPEPTIPIEEYESILDIIESTAHMLERSPKTFAGMGEEQLRDQFLVPLNSHYEGQATGETFNAAGKLDILIRSGDRTLFIAECKIWKGPQSLSSALDQLMSYATWRDSKTAIMMFNRNKNFSAVLDKIPDTLRGHLAFKREIDIDRDQGWRIVVGHPEDLSREVTITVLAFDVPA